MTHKAKKFWKFRAMTKNSAELLLYGPISETSWWGDEVTPKQFAEDLKALGDITELTVRINSGGGDVFASQAIYSLLKSHEAEVTVYIDGLAASGASIVAMAGDNIIMPRNAMMMIHNPWTIGVGNANDFRKLADDLDKIREAMIAAYQTKSGIDRDRLIELLDAETWLTAEEAIELGLADHIDEEKQVAASLRSSILIVNGMEFDLSRYKNRPRAIAAEPGKGVSKMELTEEILIQQYPDLYAEIHRKAFEEGKAVGIQAERERFRALQELETPGCEEILNKARYETGLTAEQVAPEIVKALKAHRSNLLSALVQDAAELSKIQQFGPVPHKEIERKAMAEKMAKAANEKRGVK
jgi:ATP-dependent protease ClpP protease subunit